MPETPVSLGEDHATIMRRKVEKASEAINQVAKDLLEEIRRQPPLEESQEGGPH